MCGCSFDKILTNPVLKMSCSLWRCNFNCWTNIRVGWGRGVLGLSWKVMGFGQMKIPPDASNILNSCCPYSASSWNVWLFSRLNTLPLFLHLKAPKSTLWSTLSLTPLLRLVSFPFHLNTSSRSSPSWSDLWQSSVGDSLAPAGRGSNPCPLYCWNNVLCRKKHPVAKTNKLQGCVRQTCNQNHFFSKGWLPRI